MTYISINNSHSNKLLMNVFEYGCAKFSEFRGDDSSDFVEGYLSSVHETMCKFNRLFPDIIDFVNADLVDVEDAVEHLCDVIEAGIADFFDEFPDSDFRAGTLVGLLDGLATFPEKYVNKTIFKMGKVIREDFIKEIR